MMSLFRNSGILILLICGHLVLNAQDVSEVNFLPPLRIPMLFSANFGELRPNHFHGGVDFKTESVEGKSVYSIDSGYVSRIMIRPVGYGNALYITHPSGYTSVYGHLQSFSSEIVTYITEYQLKNKMHSVDIAIPPHLLSVERGQEIAKSGNSGSSGGPHVHFEIRTKDGQKTLNPFMFYPQITDKSQPRMYSLTVFPLDSLSFVNGSEQKQVFALQQTLPGVYCVSEKIRVHGKVGIGIRVNDYMHNVHHIFGVYSATLECNGETIYARKLDSVSFYETNDINSLLDYEAFLFRKQYIEKLYVEPNNSLSIYSIKNNGISVLPQADTKNCKAVVADYHGNTASLDFTLVHDADSTLEKNMLLAMQTNSCKRSFSSSYLGFLFRADSNLFYSDFSFDIQVDSSFIAKEFSPRYTITSSEYILKTPAQISIQSTIPDSLEAKALIRFQIPKGGVLPIIPVISSDGIAHFETKRVGTYSVVIDTVAPYISSLSFINGANLSNSSRITYKISDNFSGIAEYYAYIDDEWCILNFDAKNARVTLDLSKAPIDFKNTLHTLNLVVVDVCGNSKTKKITFYK